MVYKSIITASLILSATAASAVKAYPGPIDFIQPDGTIIQIFLHGDEKMHYATTPDGCYLKPDINGKLEISNSRNIEDIATISSRQNSCSNYDRYSTKSLGEAKYRYSNSAFPTIGDPHSLVVLVEYQDFRFTDADPLSYYNDFLNGDNFNRDGATGSCRQFFIDNSRGLFSPTFDVFGPVLLKNNRRYYGSGDESNAYQMVVEAVEALDDDIDFSRYDHNGDGLVDSIYIIYADKGQNDGGPAESVWPYSWELVDEGVTLIADGVQFNTYGCSNELNGKGRINGIGTFTHEFGHVLGLPDLYNTVNSYDNTTPCKWSTMDSGNYNNDGRTPPNLSAFERYSLGWTDPEEILMENDYSLENLSTSNRAFKITTEEEPDEFFILEYRLQKGWDSFLPAEGMLIWRCEFIQSVWDDNSVNDNSRHHYVELLRADNEYLTSDSSYRGDPYPGSMGITEITSTSSPALKSWYSQRTLNVISIKNIREEEGMIKFYATVKENRIPSGIEIVNDKLSIEIKGNTIYLSEGKMELYDISGRRLGILSPTSPITVSKGIYIINGIKITI